MSNHQHDLAHEFPDMKAAIHDLKMSDNHFKRLFDEYETLCAELHRAGEGAAGISDAHAEELKKKRLTLKDDLFRMLNAATGDKKKTGSCGSCGCA